MNKYYRKIIGLEKHFLLLKFIFNYFKYNYKKINSVFIKKKSLEIIYKFLPYKYLYKIWISKIENKKLILQLTEVNFDYYIFIFSDNNIITLNRTIKSILNQKGSNVKIFVVNYENDKKFDNLETNDFNFINKNQVNESIYELIINNTNGYTFFLRNGDILRDDSLSIISTYISKDLSIDIIYSDEDFIIDNIRNYPYFKPDWSPETFYTNNYLNNLTIFKNKKILDVILLCEINEFIYNYELIMKLYLSGSNIIHLPIILVHTLYKKLYQDIVNYNKRVVISSFKNEIIVETIDSKYNFIRFKKLETPLVSIIIPTKNQYLLIKSCIESILNLTKYKNFEIIIMDNESTDYQTINFFDQIKSQNSKFIKYFKHNEPFNFSEINNRGVKYSNGDILLFLNNDTEIIQSDWLDIMVEYSCLENIGVIGAKLLYPDYTIQHSGVILGMGGIAGHAHKNIKQNEKNYHYLNPIKNYLAVTGACMMIKRNIFIDVEGFNENLKYSYNDIDLCLKVYRKGFRNLIINEVELIHYESKSRKLEDNPVKLERLKIESDYMIENYKDFIDYDPYFNINLSKKEGKFLFNLF